MLVRRQFLLYSLRADIQSFIFLKAESNYSYIEREALAIVWVTERARQFLLGRHFNLISDHCPLEFLFGTHKPLPKVMSARILRWALHLSALDFTICHEKGENNPHADALSRLSCNNCILWYSDTKPFTFRSLVARLLQ